MITRTALVLVLAAITSAACSSMPPVEAAKAEASASSDVAAASAEPSAEQVAPSASTGEPAAAPSASSAPSAAASGATTAARQPRWTMIEGVRECTGTILGSYACTPAKRPAACKETAWKELTALSGDDALTACALEPDILACSVLVKGETQARCWPEKVPASCGAQKWARVKTVKLVSACAADAKH